MLQDNLARSLEDPSAANLHATKELFRSFASRVFVNVGAALLVSLPARSARSAWVSRARAHTKAPMFTWRGRLYLRSGVCDLWLLLVHGRAQQAATMDAH